MVRRGQEEEDQHTEGWSASSEVRRVSMKSIAQLRSPTAGSGQVRMEKDQEDREHGRRRGWMQTRMRMEL